MKWFVKGRIICGFAVDLYICLQDELEQVQKNESGSGGGGFTMGDARADGGIMLFILLVSGPLR